VATDYFARVESEWFWSRRI